MNVRKKSNVLIDFYSNQNIPSDRRVKMFIASLLFFRHIEIKRYEIIDESNKSKTIELQIGFKLC
jgi:hypothetical protein